MAPLQKPTPPKTSGVDPLKKQVSASSADSSLPPRDVEPQLSAGKPPVKTTNVPVGSSAPKTSTTQTVPTISKASMPQTAPAASAASSAPSSMAKPVSPTSPLSPSAPISPASPIKPVPPVTTQSKVPKDEVEEVADISDDLSNLEKELAALSATKPAASNQPAKTDLGAQPQASPLVTSPAKPVTPSPLQSPQTPLTQPSAAQTPRAPLEIKENVIKSTSSGSATGVAGLAAGAAAPLTPGMTSAQSMTPPGQKAPTQPFGAQAAQPAKMPAMPQMPPLPTMPPIQGRPSFPRNAPQARPPMQMPGMQPAGTQAAVPPAGAQMPGMKPSMQAPGMQQPMQRPGMPPQGMQQQSPLQPASQQQPLSQKPSLPQQPTQQPPLQQQKQEPTKVTQPSNTMIKKSPFRFLPIVVGVLLLLIVGIFLIKMFGGGSKGSVSIEEATNNTTDSKNTKTPEKTAAVTLKYWGLWESDAVLQEIFADYEAANPGVKIEYTQHSPRDYRERLQAALAQGSGPDLFRYHNTWIPMIKKNLAVLPSSVMTKETYAQTFYPIATENLTTADGIVGIPLMYEGLALVYNQEMLDKAGALPPKTWEELEALSQQLAVPGTAGHLERGGVAMGLTENVDNYSDIIALMMVQNGADPADISSEDTLQAVRYFVKYFTDFGVWDESLPSSTYAFTTEKVAMILVPSWRVLDIRAVNPTLKFGVAPVPQLPDTNVSWASYWVEGVSKNTKNADAAWKFLNYMSSADVLLKFHDAGATKTPRLFGEIPSRVDMAMQFANDPYVGAYLKDAPQAKTWYLASRTWDNGINDGLIKYLGDLVNEISAGGSNEDEVIETAANGFAQKLTEFGIQPAKTQTTQQPIQPISSFGQ
jgi:multiple sugar transport system substrate-binding protein